jgi:thioredoxin-related protein
MKKLILSLFALACLAGGTWSFVVGQIPAAAKVAASNAEIKWMSWEEAVKASAKNPKKIFVDCYTDWCSWCKRMDATTFKDPAVVEQMNKQFYAVKFNAEQRENLVWRDHTFKYIASGNRGVHELAYSLLDGRLGYPSFVYLDEKFDRITISPGYKQPDQILKEMKWVGENHYKTKSLEQFSGGH